MNPEELLNKIKTWLISKIQQSLDAIYDVCIEQQERGIQDFSVSTIANLGFNRGVPKAQSIRNKTGEKYRALIQCFADASSQTAKLTKPSQTDNAWIEEIPNPKHQLLVRIMASELKEAQQMIREIIPPKQRIDIYDHKNTIPEESFKLSDQEVRALQYLLSTDFQKKWNLKPTHFGELVDESNKPVFKISTLDALRKAGVFVLNRKLLTAEGYQRLQDELNDLVRKERPEITKIVSWAASLGDRSETADYHYNKRKLREIDRRIRYLTKLFEVAQKIEYSPEQDGKAYFGAWVELENDEGETIKFRIVGDEEIYGRKDYISPITTSKGLFR